MYMKHFHHKLVVMIMKKLLWAHQSFWDTNARFKIQQVIKVLESIAEIKADFPICHVKSHNNIYSVYY